MEQKNRSYDEQLGTQLELPLSGGSAAVPSREKKLIMSAATAQAISVESPQESLASMLIASDNLNGVSHG